MPRQIATNTLPFTTVKGYVTAETFLTRGVRKDNSHFGRALRRRLTLEANDSKPENFQLFVGNFERVCTVKEYLVDPIEKGGNFQVFFSDDGNAENPANNWARRVLVIAKNKKADWRDIMSLEIRATYATKSDLKFNGKVYQAVVLEWG